MVQVKMEINRSLLIANLSVWPVIVAAVLIILIYGCLRMVCRSCFKKPARNYMVQLKDYGTACRDQDGLEHSIHNDDDEVGDRLMLDKDDQVRGDINNRDGVKDKNRLLLREARYSREDESQIDVMKSKEQQTEIDEEITQHVTELVTTTTNLLENPMYSKPDSTGDGCDRERIDASEDMPKRPIPVPRMKSSSSSEQQTVEGTNASTETTLLSGTPNGFDDSLEGDVFPSLHGIAINSLSASIVNDTSPTLGPPPLPATQPRLTRIGRRLPENASQMQKARIEELQAVIGKDQMKRDAVTTKPTPPFAVPLVSSEKCPMERECQTIAIRKSFKNSRPTAPPPSVPRLTDKDDFEIAKSNLSGAEVGGAISLEETTVAYDEICDDRLDEADTIMNHYYDSIIEDHLYDCIDDMPRSRRSRHGSKPNQQNVAFRTEGLDDNDFVNPFYERGIEMSFEKKIKDAQANLYASFIEEDEPGPGNTISLCEQGTPISYGMGMAPHERIGSQHEVPWKAEPLRFSGYLTAIESHPYNVSGYKRQTSFKGSAEILPDDESAIVKPDDTPLNEQAVQYVNEGMTVADTHRKPPVPVKGKEIKAENEHYQEPLLDTSTARTQSVKPPVPPKPKPDKRYS
ncbi:uncharacterized protein LOC124134517 isoform X2 [Haliotis rufescens]|uniref:uncharacterized protein LOC124134517 isoform X2 n=1 Tax=Haliotis rufescens TaxID=6454 RepID=UPI00201F0CB7|nr:uncharacterized protein LOC124134517 isoform X2 [Haliotis rufescens]